MLAAVTPWFPRRGGPLLWTRASWEVLRGYGTERDVAAGEVLFADGDETYDLSRRGVRPAGGGRDQAGLAASVYGASEGLATVLAEDTALGGQAGTTSRIENLLGFPAGLSGEELAARATLQAQKFGVRIKQAARAMSLSSADGLHQVSFDDGDTGRGQVGHHRHRSPVQPAAARPARRVRGGRGVLRGHPGRGPGLRTQPEVAVVGGGDSAGQAALFLSRSSAEVHVIIRGESLQA